VDTKTSATDPVSDADREAEAAIVRLLEAERPDDALLAEEGDTATGATGRRWVIDPLDGTVNFLYGNPQWCVSVAVEDAAGGLAAVVYDPLREELFRAARGGRCELNGRAVRVREPESLAAALLATGFSYRAELRAAQAEVVSRVLPRARDVRRAGSAALDLAWLAAGRVDGYWETGLNPWDWAAGTLLVTEAGGAVERISEEPPGLAAAGPRLLTELVGLVGGAA
jgi:myo-inositol-1(or 4)-monophosphatase